MSAFSMSSAATEEGRGTATHSPFLPLLLGLLAFLGWTIFQTSQLLSERSTLNQAHSAQNSVLDQAEKVRAATDSLASKTQKLADSGNASAQQVVAQLKQSGITINPNATTQAPPP